MRHYIIYIPGLGDRFNFGQSVVLWFWQTFGVRTKLVPMMWFESESYEQKLRKVQDTASAAQKAGYTVSLVGASAGASMALNAAATIPGIHRVVTIAGVTSSDLPISPATQERSPAFQVSASEITGSLKQLDTPRIHTVRALVDTVVLSSRYNDIPGAHNHRIPTIGHKLTIFLCLTVFSWYIVGLVKKS